MRLDISICVLSLIKTPSFVVTAIGPKRTWLNSNIRSNERTFECSLRDSNFAINSMRKCALISKVEKWHPHFKEWLQMLPVQVILVNLCP